jgi:pyruvate ferredoxin oxidoreductase gamma subunit
LKDITEFRWHGRGGQGSWTASEVLARTAIYEGKYIQSFPEFGPERMGAPVTAFTRISTRPIRIHCAVYEPDVVVVLDPTLLKTVPVTSG